MPEKIGKYLVRERIGRGGMGMIFKAHDPVLDRPVALKVISTEVEVTDELRARFFREAQACARLSHPNIVTIYDMGEDDGRLYIVMELLEGEELRQLIAQRKMPPLEDRLSIMAQVCDGLHYAHQRGIVHRDIKPANIFLQRNGQVKILDFGIAQIANTEGGLTRTGLIMGTLRYISPEQVRGRVDHRSDIYSVGAVFYEFLTLRPPFTGDDPMQLLEQLRTEDPPPVDRLDPSIPPALAAIIGRALRKDPAERFNDLEHMRAALEEVQTGLLEEARRIGARLRHQHGQFLELRAALAERIGAPREDETIPILEERGRLAAMQALERDLAARITSLQGRMTQADALAPAFERATELLQAGQFADAVEEFEAVVTDMPEHVRALDGLSQARARVEAQRRHQLAVTLLQDARTAFTAGEFTLSLEILKQAAEIPPPPEAVQEIASLRETAEAAATAQETTRRARQQAERARAQMAQARRAAQAQAGTQYAAALWNEAEAAGAEAEAAFAREAYADAGPAFDTATAAYRRFEESTREAQRQAAAAQAREQAAHSRQRSQAEGAPERARGLWDAAEAKSADAQAAVTDEALDRAASLFNEAVALYGRAEEAARQAVERDRRHAEEARAQAAQARERARAALAPHDTRERWDAGEAKSIEAEEAFTRRAYAPAGQAFAEAAALYRSIEEEAHAARRREREAVEQARAQMTLARQAAQAEAPPQSAPALWDDAQAKSTDAEAALARQAFAEAREAFDRAAGAYHRFEEVAREARRQARETAARAREQAEPCRARALAAAAPQYARNLWDTAEAKLDAAQAAVLAESMGPAADLFAEAAALYTRAEQEASEGRRAERRRAEEARERAAQGQRRAMAVDARQQAASSWSAATAKSAEAEAAVTREQYVKAVETFDGALALYQKAEGEARAARQRQREQAEHARQAMAGRRETALAADAATHAPSDWHEAEATVASGEDALARESYAEAREALEQAATLYRRAEERARDVARAIEIARADAERAREATAGARRSAAEAQAPQYASGQWQAAENAEGQASAALNRGEHAAARPLFAEARRQYAAAAQAAGIAVEAEGRRADAMVSDARRLLASGDVAACLRRLNEALTRHPDHAGAQQLRAEAEDRQRQAAAREAEDRRVDEMVAEAERLLAGGETEACLARLRELLALRPGHAMAERLRLEAESKLRGAEADETVYGAALHTEPPAVTVGASMSAATADLAVQGRSESPVAPAPVGRRTGRTVQKRGMIVALGGLAAALVLGIAYWTYWRPPPVVWPPPAIQELQKQAIAARDEAARAGAEHSAQFALARNNERAAEAAFGRRDASAVEQRYREAVAGYGLARTEVERGRAAAVTAASLAADARKKAEMAEAPRRASGLWAKAETAHHEAKAALERHIFDGARTLFGEAERMYGEAAQTAAAVDDQRERAEAERARTLAAAARKEAERADARRLASRSFAPAQQKEDEADASLDRDPASARLGFQEAARAYKRAAQEAAGQHVTLQRADATQARARMMEARREAEQAAAGQRAPVLLDWGQKKEREASAAFERPDYALAERLFGEAQADYESAAREARRAPDRVASQQLYAEQARRRTAAYRESAVKAEADRLAGDLFAIAQAKEAGADELMGRRSFALASEAYGEVGDRYLAAARRAHDRRDADGARVGMRAEKQRAVRNAPEYKDALAEESHGTGAYERLAYKEAAERFRTAQMLYARATTKTAAPASSPPRAR